MSESPEVPGLMVSSWVVTSLGPLVILLMVACQTFPAEGEVGRNLEPIQACNPPQLLDLVL